MQREPSNQSMKPTAHCEATSACLSRHPAVAYLFLVRPNARCAVTNVIRMMRRSSSHRLSTVKRLRWRSVPRVASHLCKPPRNHLRLESISEAATCRSHLGLMSSPRWPITTHGTRRRLSGLPRRRSSGRAIACWTVGSRYRS